MADFKLNYTGAQINTLLEKVSGISSFTGVQINTILGNANTWINSNGIVNNATIGPLLKLPSGETTLSLLTSGGAAINLKSGRLGLGDSYAALDLTNYRFHCMGTSRFDGQIYVDGGGIQMHTTNGNSIPSHYISAGAGYSTATGKTGVKLIVCEQSDCMSGLGQDCCGGPYELSVITSQQPASATTAYIRFCRHAIGSTSYTKLGEINGSGVMYASSFSSTSSKFVKENIRLLNDNEAKKLLDIEPIIFDFKEAWGGQKNQAGCIAEQVLEHIPQVVNIPNDYNEELFDEAKGTLQPILSIDYSRFVPYLIKMIQIQDQEIKELKFHIDLLKRRVGDING